MPDARFGVHYLQRTKELTLVVQRLREIGAPLKDEAEAKDDPEAQRDAETVLRLAEELLCVISRRAARAAAHRRARFTLVRNTPPLLEFPSGVTPS